MTNRATAEDCQLRWLLSQKGLSMLRLCPIRRYGRRTRRSWGYSLPVAASFSRCPGRPAHREARVFCGRSRPRLTVVLLREPGAALGALHGALLNVLAFSCARERDIRERNAPWRWPSEQNCSSQYVIFALQSAASKAGPTQSIAGTKTSIDSAEFQAG